MNCNLIKIRDKKIIKHFLKRIYLSFLIILIKPLLYFAKSAKEDSDKKTILIVKLDAIGDYIIFRNFLREVKLSEKYKNYKLVFLGNQIIAPLATWLDSPYVDKFIFIDKRKFYRNPFYLLRTLLYIGIDYEITIQPTFSRDIISDFFVKTSNAKERLSFVGDTNNISAKDKKISDSWYTDLIKVKNRNIFEFYREKSFFEQITGKKINLIRPTISLKEVDCNDNCLSVFSGRYIVIFPGAGIDFRRWPIKKMADLAHFLNKEYEIKIVIAGSISDSWMGKNIRNTYPEDDFIDLTGKTDLRQLVILISKAELLVTNDTSAAHIGSALNVKTFVLSQFNHFGRFVPYPNNSKSSMVCIFPDIYKNISFKNLVDKFAYGSDVDINLISLEKTKEVIKKYQIN